ncbi:MAG: hypothetical protein Q7V01_11380 [Vicinamibacterales bacterium]|nr:hypothetical protein [Vicinamibacterales bacterium]
MDDEEGTTAEAVRGLYCRVLTQVRRSRLGAPLLDDLLRIGREHASGDIIAFITADIVAQPNLAQVAEACHALMGGKPYLAVAGRVDLLRPVESIDSSCDWFEQLREATKLHGRPHGFSAIDLWIYPKTWAIDPPPFPIGRGGTDNWVVYKARTSRVPVVDVTADLLLIHQWHDKPARKSPRFREEFYECVRLFDNIAENAMSLLDADMILRDGQLRRPTGFRRVHSSMSLFRPYRKLLAQYRRIRKPHIFRHGACEAGDGGTSP